MKVSTDKTQIILRAEDLCESMLLERISNRFNVKINRNKSGRAIAAILSMFNNDNDNSQENNLIETVINKTDNNLTQPLTRIEREIVSLYIAGLSTKNIAKELSLSSRNVDYKLASVRKKLRAKHSVAMAYILGENRMLENI